MQVGVKLVDAEPNPMTDRLAERNRTQKARKIVETWNRTLASGERPMFVPTFEAVQRAEAWRLRLLCPGCRTQFDVDLRRFGRQPLDMPITGLGEALRCQTFCRPEEAPMPVLVGLVICERQYG